MPKAEVQNFKMQEGSIELLWPFHVYNLLEESVLLHSGRSAHLLQSHNHAASTASNWLLSTAVFDLVTWTLES